MNSDFSNQNSGSLSNRSNLDLLNQTHFSLHEKKRPTIQISTLVLKNGHISYFFLDKLERKHRLHKKKIKEIHKDIFSNFGLVIKEEALKKMVINIQKTTKKYQKNSSKCRKKKSDYLKKVWNYKPYLLFLPCDLLFFAEEHGLSFWNVVLGCNREYYQLLHPIFQLQEIGKIKGFGQICMIRKRVKSKPYSTGGKRKKFQMRKDVAEIFKSLIDEVSKDPDSGIKFFKETLQTRRCKILQEDNQKDQSDRILKNITHIVKRLKSKGDRKLILSTLSPIMSNSEIQQLFSSINPELRELFPSNYFLTESRRLHQHIIQTGEAKQEKKIKKSKTSKKFLRLIEFIFQKENSRLGYCTELVNITKENNKFTALFETLKVQIINL